VLAPPPIPTVIVCFFAVIFTFLVVIARREARGSPWGGVFSSSVLAKNLDTVPLEVDEEHNRLWEYISFAAAKGHPDRRLHRREGVLIHRHWAAHLAR
jgi:hypothetical protein